VKSHASVRTGERETLTGLLNAEADALCGAKRYERSPERVDSRAGRDQRSLEIQAACPRAAEKSRLSHLSDGAGCGAVLILQFWNGQTGHEERLERAKAVNSVNGKSAPYFAK